MQVTEFTDLGCVCSWVFDPVGGQVRRRFGARVTWRRVMGIQLDGDAPGEPERSLGADVEPLRSWREIARLTLRHRIAPRL